MQYKACLIVLTVCSSSGAQESQQCEPCHEKTCLQSFQHIRLGERSGSVVERRILEPEVGGSKPTSAMFCP